MNTVSFSSFFSLHAHTKVKPFKNVSVCRRVCVTYSRHWYCCDHLPVLIHYCTFICHLVCASLGSLACMTEEADSLAEKDAGSSEGRRCLPAWSVGVPCAVCVPQLHAVRTSLSSNEFAAQPEVSKRPYRRYPGRRPDKA